MSNPICSSPECDRQVEKPPRGQMPSYCSAPCRSRASYLRRRDQLLAKWRDATATRRSNMEKACPTCGSTFTPAKYAGQKHCTPKCATIATRDTLSKMCSESGCERPVRAKGICAMHYKAVMRAEGRYKNPEWDDRRKTNWKKRYALSRGATTADAINYMRVFGRDNWTCGICKLSVNPVLEWPDPMSKSLDHIIPVALGGSHTYDNVQLAHLTCNIKKGGKQGKAAR